MRSISSRAAMLGIAGLIAVSTMAPASAATKHRHAAPAPSAASADVQGLPIRPDWSAIPAGAYQQPNGCYTDEGYGRYTSCEQGGF